MIYLEQYILEKKTKWKIEHVFQILQIFLQVKNTTDKFFFKIKKLLTAPPAGGGWIGWFTFEKIECEKLYLHYNVTFNDIKAAPVV